MIYIYIPSKYKRKAKGLLYYLKTPTPLNWKENAEVLLYDKLLSNTHITDWIREVVIPNTRSNPPGGFEQFYNFLFLFSEISIFGRGYIFSTSGQYIFLKYRWTTTDK